MKPDKNFNLQHSFARPPPPTPPCPGVFGNRELRGSCDKLGEMLAMLSTGDFCLSLKGSSMTKMLGKKDGWFLSK